MCKGGGCMTVGVAGLILGGGFGSYSKGYSLAAASLIEAEIVTADGEVRIANACSNPDLFWALKGGGGGFGVVTRVTLQDAPAARILRRRVRDHQGGVRRGLSPPDRKNRRILRRGAFQSALGRADPASGAAPSRFRWPSRALIINRRKRCGNRSSIGSPLRRRISPSYRRRESSPDRRGAAGTRPRSSRFRAWSSPTIARTRRRTTSSGPATSKRRERSGTPTNPLGCPLRSSKRTGGKASLMRYLRRRSIWAWRCISTRGLRARRRKQSPRPRTRR